MSDATDKTQDARTSDSQEPRTVRPAQGDKPAWQTPKMQDVSQQVMAQPYIRFT
jgi:hypothetical protein